MSAMNQLIRHIEQTRYESLPESTIDACKTFILDSIGVGISGSRVHYVDVIKQALAHQGNAAQAQVWVTGEWAPAHVAAAINGYQIHNQEWDCVHERAVVHPMAVILSALVAFAQKENLSGKALILGVAVAVDVATLIGSSASSGLKFFRPAVCGCLGATAGICAMLNIKGVTLENALGIAYSQISGTMQAHVEGSPMLAMQIATNAATSVNAIQLALAGFQGPKDILEGPFGYLKLFEDSYDLSYFHANLGKQYQIERVSHKPFPTGRAGHGTIDGIQTLQRNHTISIEQIHAVEIEATPLINRLVGRPAKAGMDANYAKLCNGYIAATALLTGSVNAEDFSAVNLACPLRLALAAKVHTRVNTTTDPNALAPVTVRIAMKNGEVLHVELPAVLGHPDRPLSGQAQLKKFRDACRSAARPFSDTQIDNLINRIDTLEQMQNIKQLVELTISNI